MIAAILLAAALAQVAPSSEQFYAEALRNTRLLTEPANATYTVDVHVANARFLRKRMENARAETAFEMGDPAGKAQDSFAAAYRDSDDLTAIQVPNGGWATQTNPFLNPTWTGIADWMKYGIDGRPASQHASHALQTVSSSTPTRETAPPTITVVSVMGLAYYNVFDAGIGHCANGDPGHAVHLVARRNAHDHALTGATIDLRTHRLCMIQIGFPRLSAGPLEANGLVDADLSEKDGMVLISHEHIELNVHAFAIQVKHIVAEVDYHDFAFPQALDQEMFK